MREGKTMFTIRFGIENAAFVDDQAGEVARILRKVADEVRVDSEGGIFDLNGNHVGTWSMDAD